MPEGQPAPRHLKGSYPSLPHVSQGRLQTRPRRHPTDIAISLALAHELDTASSRLHDPTPVRQGQQDDQFSDIGLACVTSLGSSPGPGHEAAPGSVRPPTNINTSRGAGRIAPTQTSVPMPNARLNGRCVWECTDDTKDSTWLQYNVVWRSLPHCGVSQASKHAIASLRCNNNKPPQLSANCEPCTPPV